MTQICDPKLCTGCFACLNACKPGAIGKIADSEGFAHPKINENICVDCGKCRQVCPANHLPEMREPRLILSGWNNNAEIRRVSSSGGLFSVLAEAVLAENGSVFGAAMDEKLKVVHIGISSTAELYRLRGSKYLQSDVADTYRQVKRLLSDGRRVLFSGTPCYIAGLTNYLGKDYNNLITVDIVCHGVPSPLIFEEWKEWFKKSHSLDSLSSVRFRDKKWSWLFFNMEIKGMSLSGKEMTYAGKFFKDEWIRGFLSDRFLRPACYECPFAKAERCSDITLADWWGYKGSASEPKDYEKRGISLIFCNTKKGADFFKDKCSSHVNCRERRLAEALKTNPTLSHPTHCPADREAFWHCFSTESFADVVKKFMHPLKPNMQQRIMMMTGPGKLRSIMLDIYYKFRHLNQILTGKGLPENERMTIYQRICRRLKWYRSRYFKYHYKKVVRNSLSKKSGKTIYLFCPPVHNNLGDQAQTMCILRWMGKYYPKHEVKWIPMQLSDDTTIRTVAGQIEPDDLVFIHSGYLTTEMYGYLPFMAEIVAIFRKNPVVILPQTVNIMTEEMRELTTATFNSNPNVLLLCRDEISYQKAKEMFTCKVELWPDFVTMLIGNDEFNFGKKRKGVLMVLRDDKEKLYSDEQLDRLSQNVSTVSDPVSKIDTTIKISPFAWIHGREKIIKKYLKIFAQNRLVITDRYHGTIFAQIVGTPTIVISSSDHKLESGVRWFPTEFNSQLYFARTLEEAETLAKQILADKERKECRSTYFYDNYWSKLHELINRHCNNV